MFNVCHTGGGLACLQYKTINQFKKFLIAIKKWNAFLIEIQSITIQLKTWDD